MEGIQVQGMNRKHNLNGKYHYQKDEKLATISCEVLFDRKLYLWDLFVGCCGSNNEITVLENSPLINDLL